MIEMPFIKAYKNVKFSICRYQPCLIVRTKFDRVQTKTEIDEKQHHSYIFESIITWKGQKLK